MQITNLPAIRALRPAWNKGRIVGQKRPVKLKQVEASAYCTHSTRRKMVTQIHKKTGNLRAVQLQLGHTKMDSTVRYLGVEQEDALAIAESIKIWRQGPSSRTTRRLPLPRSTIRILQRVLPAHS